MIKKNEEIKKNLILLLITFFIFLLIFEIILRLFSFPIYGFQKGAFTYNEHYGYGPTPNYSGVQTIYGNSFLMDINEKGMRDTRNYDYLKNKKRILILGDSFSFGNGVNLKESYPEKLRENFGEEVEILNLGVPGFGINNEYVYYLEKGKKFNPDIILIQYHDNDWGTHKINYENNSLKMSLTKVDFSNSLIADKNGFIISSQGETFTRSIHLIMLRNSRAYSFIYLKIRKSISNIVNRYWNRKGVPPFLENKNSESYQENLRGYYDILKNFKNLNENIVIFGGPAIDDQIYPETIRKEFNLDYLPERRQTKKSLKLISEELGIYFIDIDYNATDIFIPVDKHWNEKGNQLVADKIYEQLNLLINPY